MTVDEARAAWHASGRRYVELWTELRATPTGSPRWAQLYDKMDQVLAQHKADFQRLRVALGVICPVCRKLMVDSRCPDEAAHDEIERLTK